MKPSKPATPAKGTLSTIPTPLSVLAKLPVNGRAVVTEVIEDVDHREPTKLLLSGTIIERFLRRGHKDKFFEK